MPNTFGHVFRVTTFGESHGSAVGAVIDGCPAGLSLSLERVQEALNRRKPGQNSWTSSRKESDRVECVSGIEDGISLGTPITLLVRNEDKKPDDYSELQNIFRPSHSDYTTQIKYGIRPKSGGGRSSARETLARVAAAAIAEQVLEILCPELRVVACVSSIKNLEAHISEHSLTRATVDQNAFRFPDEKLLPQVETLLTQTRDAGDSVGGCISCFVLNCPAGLGDPVFDKLNADFAKAMLSLPAARAFEVGSGFESCKLFGSENNDPFVSTEKGIRTLSNRSGGIQGGISNGETIKLRIGFKAPSSIFKPQQTVDKNGNNVEFQMKQGRHDPCVLARAVPIVEAMTLLVLTDHILRQKLTHLT